MTDYSVDLKSLAQRPAISRLFLAEGPSEVGLLSALLKSRRADADAVAILCFKGIVKLGREAATMAKVLALDAPLERFRAIGLLADAETDPVGRLDAVLAGARAFGFRRCDAALRGTARADEDGRLFRYFLTPGAGTAGRIEDLVLDEIADDPLNACVRAAVDCLAATRGRAVDTKAHVQMFISAKHDSALAGIGRAFEAGVLDCASPAYGPVAQMVDDVLSH